ncbi:MAG: 2-oxoacid:acceptor oxidoreductase family protein, partial [Thermodesulfobacteriota bacterium]
AFNDGNYAQAFPSFGSERMGAPVESYVKIAEAKIRSKTQVYHPDYLIIQDPTLFSGVDVLKGIKEDGLIIVNTEKIPDALSLNTGARVMTIPATKLALEILGRPIPNTTLLGAFSGATGVVSLQALVKSLEGRFSGSMLDKNLKAANAAYERMRK